MTNTYTHTYLPSPLSPKYNRRCRLRRRWRRGRRTNSLVRVRCTGASLAVTLLLPLHHWCMLIAGCRLWEEQEQHTSAAARQRSMTSRLRFKSTRHAAKIADNTAKKRLYTKQGRKQGLFDLEPVLRHPQNQKKKL